MILIWILKFREFSQLAAATSSDSIHLFDLNNNKGITQIRRSDIDALNFGEKHSICGVRFGPTSPHILYVATKSAQILAYDLRTALKPVHTFENTKIRQKSFITFDVNSSETTVCAGTEQSDNEAYVVLFDVRKQAPLTAYSDSHSDDVTQVKFHPMKADILGSGSTDGLINVFDITQPDEDDALESCFNTESTIQTINWQSDVESNRMSCITGSNDFQLIHFDADEELVLQKDRDDIAELIQRKLGDDCYLINCHETMDGQSFLLAGSQFNAGECMRSLTIDGKLFKTRSNFIDNKQIIRCSVFSAKDNILVTAGEGGIVTVWQNRESSNSDCHALKEMVKTKEKRKSKPY